MSFLSETAFRKKHFPRQEGIDWQEGPDGLWYSAGKELYWKDGRHYDRLSASHNGLIGAGAQLKEILR